MTDMQSRSFVGFDISKKTWRKTTLKDIAKLEKGEQLNRIFLQAEGKYPVMNGGISPSGYTNTFNTRSNTVTISEGGNSCGYVNYLKENFWSGGHCYSLSKIKTSSLFLFYLLKSNEKNIQKLRVGSGLPNIQKKDLENIILSIPERSEQEKIGILFENFDKLIEDKEKKLTKLEQIKKTMLSKMFPKSGTYIPEIRFKGFHDKWKKLKFEDIAHFYSGGTPNTANREYYGGNIPFIKSAEIYYSYTQEHLTQIGLENSSAKWVKKGDLLYALYGANSGEVAISKIDGVINQAVLCIKNISKKFHTYFLYSFLLVNKKNIVDRLLQGGQGNLSATLIKKIQIQLPSMDEQTKIGGYFEKLDRHIELQNQEIQKLKQLKHSLLTNMLKVDIKNQVEKT